MGRIPHRHRPGPRFTLEGNTLKLTTAPTIDPATGEKTIRELIWQKN
jgi:hypothetical protein